KIAIQTGKIFTETIGEQKIVFEPGGIMATDAWENFYLRCVIAKCDHLDLSAIDDTTIQGQVSGQKGSIKISDVFTTLFLKGVTRTSGQSIKEALGRNREKEIWDVKGEDKESVPIQAIEAAGAMNRLVILGRPRGRKSTLSNHIVSTLANIRLGVTGKDEKLPGWNNDTLTVPVRIILREFAVWMPADKRYGTAGIVWEYIEHLLTEWGCQEHFNSLKHKLADEGGVVIFDGLDEVREEDEDKKRSLIVESISE
ncbi:MAG: hypothetical protein GY786_10010, partial [Proteobacteria bacterium]|nr:hypothetical protein [Pseudomonadota bacterium]